MTMSEVLPLLLAMAAGLALGAMFFGGLLWTVRRIVSSPRPALVVSVSLVLRMGLALAGFYLVSNGDWRRLLACLAGFAAARLAVTWLYRPASGARHAP